MNHITQQITSAQAGRDLLLRQNKGLTDKINATKRQLQGGGNPLAELRLQNDLKASRELADRIQALDQQIYALTAQSVATKRQLVNMLTHEIERLSQAAHATENAKQARQRLDQVLQLQKEKENYQTQISTESNELLLGLDITLAGTDGPDEILQKLAIVRDQRDIIGAKIQQLDQHIQETQKNLSLRRNMLELLRDIRRGEDDEFDLDRSLRIAELQEDITDIETTLEIMGAKQESWRMREKALVKKAKQFAQEAEKFTQPVPKGDSVDRE
ncbi:MAG: hypothetical protein O7E52_16315 [Candidatus Poribacteria bacterium]|nr:hypothetical protein [Candidatus Poribacteria bacterium]